MKAPSALDKVLADWAREWSAENIDAATQKLINLATYDLYFGPVGDGAAGDPADGDSDWDGWPGFSKACDAIEKVLRDLPRELYVDVDCGYWQEEEPRSEKCDACQENGETCEVCGGSGWIDPIWENWMKLDRTELKKLIVGKELAEYV
jgi:hypothetical protein